jgi:hypothetical protein
MRAVDTSCHRFRADRAASSTKRLTVGAATRSPALSIEPKKGESPPRRTERRGESLKLQSRLLLRVACVGIVLAPASIGLAAAAAMPTLNIAPTCESEGRKAMALGNSSIEACKRSELEARHGLSKKWSQYEAGDRTTCMGRISHGGHPSYVELQSCLESFRHAREIRAAHAKGRSHSTPRGKDTF